MSTAQAPIKNQSDAVELLRHAWRHLQTSNRLIAQARRNPTDNVVVEGLLILALDHIQKSKSAMEGAAKILRLPVTTSADKV
jgi:hypothetical protein